MAGSCLEVRAGFRKPAREVEVSLGSYSGKSVPLWGQGEEKGHALGGLRAEAKEGSYGRPGNSQSQNCKKGAHREKDGHLASLSFHPRLSCAASLWPNPARI